MGVGFRATALFGAATLLAGCATVTRGLDSQIQVRSEPAGAEVRTSLSQTCTTPCTLKVSRKDEFSVLISKDGFKPVEVEVMNRIAGEGAAGFAGNVLVGGIVGMGVDAATGATLEHYPNPIDVTLEPLPRHEPAPARKPRQAPRAPTAAPAPAASPSS